MNPAAPHPPGSNSPWRLLSALVVILSLTALYLYVFPSPTLTYISVVIIHAGLGLLAALLLLPKLRRLFSSGFVQTAGWWLFVPAAALGIVLLFVGTSHPEWNWLYAHIVLSFAAVAVLAAHWAGKRGWLGQGTAGAVLRLAICFALAATVGLGGWQIRQGRWLAANRITNPASAPESMDGEGDGPNGPFFPSSSQTAHAGKIPGKYFMESDACESCH